LLAKTFEDENNFGDKFRQKYDAIKGEFSKHKRIKNEFGVRNFLTMLIMLGEK